MSACGGNPAWCGAAVAAENLHPLVEAAADDLQLVFAAQLGEVHGIARYADRQLRIVLGMLHGVFEHRAVQHVDVQVVCALRKAVSYTHLTLPTTPYV